MYKEEHKLKEKEGPTKLHNIYLQILNYYKAFLGGYCQIHHFLTHSIEQ
jgi:hypothetical protein